MPNLSWSGELLLVPAILFEANNMWSWGTVEAFEIPVAPCIAIARLELLYGDGQDNDKANPVYVLCARGVGWLATDEMELA